MRGGGVRGELLHDLHVAMRCESVDEAERNRVNNRHKRRLECVPVEEPQHEASYAFRLACFLSDRQLPSGLVTAYTVSR